MNWKEYEIYITKHFQRMFPYTSIQHNVLRDALLSKTKRQIDILIEGKIAGFELRVIIDCKYFNKKVDVKDVESFLSFLQDLKASKGILITNNGYSAADYSRATNDTQDIELRIINFNDLDKWQGFIAIPYSAPHCAIVSAPDGWVVDSTGFGPHVAAFYPAGLTKKEASQIEEGSIYFGFSHKNKLWPDLPDLLEKHKSPLTYDHLIIEYIDTIVKDSCNTMMRIIDAKEMGKTIEYTLFLDYPGVIIYMT